MKRIITIDANENVIVNCKSYMECTIFNLLTQNKLLVMDEEVFNQLSVKKIDFKNIKGVKLLTYEHNKEYQNNKNVDYVNVFEINAACDDYVLINTSKFDTFFQDIKKMYVIQINSVYDDSIESFNFSNWSLTRKTVFGNCYFGNTFYVYKFEQLLRKRLYNN